MEAVAAFAGDGAQRGQLRQGEGEARQVAKPHTGRPRAVAAALAISLGVLLLGAVAVSLPTAPPSKGVTVRLPEDSEVEPMKAVKPEVASLEVRDVHSQLSEDGERLSVEFTYDGEEQRYELYATSVFAQGGKIIEHGENGTVHTQPQSRRLFRCDIWGKRASARLHTDGSVTGLFQNGDFVVRIKPPPTPKAAPSREHHIHYFPPPEFLPKQADGARLKKELRGGSLEHAVVQTSRRLEDPPPVATEEDDAEFVHASDWPEDEVPTETGPGAKIKALAQWGGQRWWPGCYPGDSEMQDFHINIYLDNKAWVKHEDDGVDGVTGHIEDAIREASLIYEMQMNVKFVVDEFVIYKTTNNAPEWAVGCPTQDNIVEPKLNQLTADKTLSFAGAQHLLTGCGKDHGYVGLAYIGTICNKFNFNTGVSQIHDKGYEETFLTMAHELGHNFGADHSFEEGQGKTGGIMDYGDGHLNGIYQFNTKYRRDEVCSKLSDRANNCQGKFTTHVPTPSPPGSDSGSDDTSVPTGQGTCKTTGSGGVGRDHSCVFPFIWDDTTYHACSTDGHHTIWCATEVDADNKMIDAKWAECSWSPQCLGQDEPCYTTGDAGVGEGHACVFPFNYHREFRACTALFHTTMWCATKVDDDGNMVEWGDCDKTDYCRSHWKTLGWISLPHDLIAKWGNQAASHWEQAIANAKEETRNWWQRVVDWFKGLFGMKEEEPPDVAENKMVTLWSATGPVRGGARAWRSGILAGAAVALLGMAVLVAARRGRQYRREPIASVPALE